MELYLCESITRRADAYALLACAARRHWGLDRLPSISRGEHGKPFFPDHPEYHFNLSHSGPLALCAVDDHPVGVDIEVIRPHHSALAQRICCAEELAWLEAQNDPIFALCQLWTRKEALTKYHGTGLTVPLRSIRPPLPPAAQSRELNLHSFGTQVWCACACGHTVPAPPVCIPPEEIFG